MSGQTSASPSIDEPRPKGSAQPELALQSSADPAQHTNTLAASSGMLSDIRRSRLLPALVEAPAPRRATRAFPVGILLYLASVGIIAIATIGVFFGLGFFLLARPTEAMIANDAGAKQDSTVNRRRQQIMVTTSPMSGDVASVPIQPEVLRSAATAALPVAPLVPSSSRRLEPVMRPRVPYRIRRSGKRRSGRRPLSLRHPRSGQLHRRQRRRSAHLPLYRRLRRPRTSPPGKSRSS